jgi:hypothetical protein
VDEKAENHLTKRGNAQAAVIETKIFSIEVL